MIHKTAHADTYPLEFITQEHASLNALTYGFKLLEDIRQIRMGCEERRDELERNFTLELQNWMKYTQQAQQVIDQPDFEKYSSESRNVVEETISSTYRELYSRRMRKLTAIERHCDDELNELLQSRKSSMLLLVANLINTDPGRLKNLVTELIEYKAQLQNGLQSCIERQASQYVSRLSSKVLAPEDHCSGPDIQILTAFLDRMLDIIEEEQADFFGDDEDLGIDTTPCGISGCQEMEKAQDITHSGLPPSTTQPSTHTTHPPSSPPSELPHPHDSTQPPPTESTQIPMTDMKAHPPTSEFSTEPDTIPTTSTVTSPQTDPETKPAPSTSTETTTESTDQTPTASTDQTTSVDTAPPTTPISIQTETTLETEPPTAEQTSTQPTKELPTITVPIKESTTPTAPGIATTFSFMHIDLHVSLLHLYRVVE